jgi:type IV pilus assembly protein PilA
VEEPCKDGFEKEESHVLQMLRRRLQGEREGGFTLIELMVVVLIIAILIAIAIPTFLGARTRAQDRAAQTSLRNALVAAKSIYTDKQDYAQAIKTASADPLEGVEPTLDYVVTGTASSGPNVVSTGNSGTGIWYGAVKSDSSGSTAVCFYIKDDVSSGTTYATGSTCTATAAASATYGSKW